MGSARKKNEDGVRICPHLGVEHLLEAGADTEDQVGPGPALVADQGPTICLVTNAKPTHIGVELGGNSSETTFRLPLPTTGDRERREQANGEPRCLGRLLTPARNRRQNQESREADGENPPHIHRALHSTALTRRIMRSRSEGGEVPHPAVFSTRGRGLYSAVRRAPRGEKTVLGAVHRRPQ